MNIISSEGLAMNRPGQSRVHQVNSHSPSATLPMVIAASDINVQSSFDGVILNVEALWRGIRVGYVWCMIVDDRRLLVSDMHINDQVPTSHPFARWLLNVIGIPCKTLSFRGIGVGRRMMRAVISEARKADIREVWGSVTSDDINRTPHLLDKYRSLGFTVLDADRECIRSAAKKIVMKLDEGNFTASLSLDDPSK